MARGAALTGRARALAARAMIRWEGWRPPADQYAFALFLVGILAYGAAFAWYMLGRFDLIDLILVYLDDAFYYFQIAWHMARGELSTFDGGITRTNGYHPLWLLLITPFYWVFDKTEALFAIKAFEIMLVAGGVSLVAAAARLARLPWILLFAALPTLYQQRGMLLGLEAAAGLFMLGLFFLAIVLFARDPARWRWPLAVVAFALPWVRLEYAAISLSATAALLLIEWSWQDRPPSGVRARSILACKTLGPLLAAGASLLMYFGYNGVVFGGIVPVSAAIKRVWSQIRWESEGGYDLTGNFRDFLQMPAFNDELWIVLGIFVFVLLTWWSARRTRSREGWLLLAFLVGLFGLAAGHLAKFVQSVLTVHPSVGNYGWYFVPAYLMKVIVVPAGCYVAIWFIRRLSGPRLPRASRTLILGIVVSGAAYLYAKVDFTAPFQFVDRKDDPTILHEWSTAGYMGTMVMNRVLPEGSVVGAWDAGVVGYFSRFPVVNLDGLANSFGYLDAIWHPDTQKRRIPEYFGITHYTNHRPATHPIHDSTLFEGLPCCFQKNGFRKFQIWSKEPRETLSGKVDRSDWFWERMEPHFERQTGDDVGLLVDGRIAQAFARSCAPADLAVWAGDRHLEETRIKSWKHTQTGLCVSTMLLPPGASDVRVARMTAAKYADEYTREYTREYLADLRKRQPVIDSNFDVHFIGRRLIYLKEACGTDDFATRFYLHLYPVSPDDLDDHRRRRHVFNNLDFEFSSYATVFDGTCWMELPLPDYDIALIRTGQYVEMEGVSRNIWKGEIWRGEAGLR